MPQTENICIRPITEVAEALGLTPRRVRQFVEDGNVPRTGRGKVDLTWTMYFHLGSVQVADWTRKPKDPKTLIALSWLSALGAAPSAEDIDKFAGLFIRNGFTRDDALLSLGKAEALVK